MYKHFVPAALVLLSISIWAYGQSPELQQSDTPAVPAGPALSPEPTTMDQAPPLMNDCGCQETTSCDPCGCQPQRRSLKEKCAYYRAMRQSYRDEPCCGDYFGGFGPLWESYCADKQRGCGGAAGCESAAACCPPAAGCGNCTARLRLPVLHLRGALTRHHCARGGVACDCATAATQWHEEGELEIGIPPAPTEAEPPAEPAATTRLDAPSVTAPETTTSARRGWIQRSLNHQPNG